MRMPVGITGATADHCIFRNSLLKQIPGGGGRTVMSRNDHIAGKIQSQITDRFLTGRLRISRKQEMIASVFQSDRNRIIVIIAADRLGRKNRKFPASEGEIRSWFRMLHSQSLRGNTVLERLIDLRILHIIRADHIFYGKTVQTSYETSHMILIIMGGDHIVDGRNILFLQIRNHETGMSPVTAVIQKILSPRLYQDRKSLSHIQKMDSHCRVSRSSLSCISSRGNSCGCQQNKQQRKKKRLQFSAKRKFVMHEKSPLIISIFSGKIIKQKIKKCKKIHVLYRLLTAVYNVRIIKVQNTVQKRRAYMLAVNYTNLRENMKNYMDKVTDDYETMIVTRKNNRNVVMMSEESYNNLMENLYLMEDRANYDWIMESKKQLQEGKAGIHKLKEVE